MADANAAASTAQSVADSSWDGDPARFTIAQWRNSCLIDHGGNENDKSNFSLPVRNPDGRLNRGALAAAAARLRQVEGINADQRATAANQLIKLYGNAGLPAPDGLQEIAGPSTRSVTYSTMERRSTPVTVTADVHSRVLAGYAVKFNRSSRMMPMPTGRGAFVEQVAPGFFDEARRLGWPGLSGEGVVARFNHSDLHTLGSTRSGSLELAVDDTGLEYRTAPLPPSRDDVVDLALRGDITNSSFTFALAQDDWNFSNGVAQRTLITGVLLDVAPVAGTAAYPDSTCALRSLAAAKDVPFDDVVDLAVKDELRQLFTRSDHPTMLPESVRIQHEHMKQILRLHEMRIRGGW